MLKRFFIGLRQGFNQPFFDLTRCKGALIKNKQIRDGNNEPRSEILKRHQPRVGHARSTSLTYRSNRPERSAEYIKFKYL